MKKFKKIIATTLLTSLFITSCGSNETEKTSAPADNSNESEVINNESKDEISLDEVGLKVNFTTGNNQRTLTYNQADPLALPDGEVVTAGELKPLWQYIGDTLSIDFEDVAIQDQKATDMIQLEAATGFKNADIFGGNSIAEDLMRYGTEGYFINLNDYLDKMPNYSSYLEKNPNILKAITAYDGGMYHIPYIAEIDNYARVFTVRADIIELLLEGEMQDESQSLTVKYNPYWVGDNERHSTNIIELQNKAAEQNGGKLTADIAREVLVNYINETYDYENPSELYLGDEALYDIDEYVALLRLAKISPNTVSFNATGKVVDGAIVQPFFVRQTKYREDVIRLINYFGGTRVFGSDTYTGRFVIDENDELQYSYATDEFINTLPYIQNMYSEGLISAEFSDLNNKANFRTEYFGKDDVEGQKLFGIATNDWIASTSSVGKVVGMLPPVTKTNGEEFVHYIENTRVIKPDGWSISSGSSEEAIDRAVVLFDYLFSEEGNIVQNYGVPSMIDPSEKFVGPDGVEYPKIGQFVIDNAEKYSNGDYSQFLRDFVGGILPVGFQKAMGFEYQYTNEAGYDIWSLYQNNNVLSLSYGATENYYKLSPPVFSLTDQELAKIGTTNISETQVDEIFKYITNANEALPIEELKSVYTKNGIDTYIQQYRNAYQRQK